MKAGKFPVRLFPCLTLAALPAIAADCESLAKLTLPATTITAAQPLPAGSFTPPSAQRPLENLPQFCRVAGVIKPSKDSLIQFETWMPLEGWNGKFQGIGNGGFAGAISYGGLADAVRNGYAAASTDTGHQGGGTNADWALGHPEKIVDFGHRAIHEMTVKGKAIVEAFYGSAPQRSYFSSCSNGGRQALMEAQRYPDDYDGIIAGAPANYWTHLMASFIIALQATDGAGYIPAAKLPAIQAAALAACDTDDSVKDGVIENPAACGTVPAALICKADDSEGCLSAGQSNALKKLYDGLRDSKGNLLFPGYAPGGEAEQGGWEPWITGESQDKSLLYLFGTNFFKNMVFNDPAWDFRNFNADRDLKTAVQKTGAMLNAADPDLSRFEGRGGKLILYHGWSDAAIPGQSAVNYYESVVRKLGKQTTAGFVRLFMAPGMQHCGGGSGPNVFGQGGVAKGNPESNIAAALEQWVERGIAPDRIIATKYKKGSDPESGVERTRPLCAYPEVARYKGTGSTDDAANFECVLASHPAKK